MACSDCPDFITATIADQVQQTLNRVREIKWITASFNGVLAGIADKVKDDLTKLAGLVPVPPVLDLSAIVGMLLCPLTPVALSIDPALVAAMDPRQVLVRTLRQMQAETRRVVAAYNLAIAQYESFDIITTMRNYVNEIYRAVGDPSEFIVSFAFDVGYSAIVQSLCPDIYADPEWPFMALTEEVSDFTFDGVVPSGIDPRALANVTLVAEAEVKLLGWRSFAATVIL